MFPPRFLGGNPFFRFPPRGPQDGGEAKIFFRFPPRGLHSGGELADFLLRNASKSAKFSACGGQITSPPDNEGELSAKNGFPPNRGGKLSPPDVSGLGGNFPPQTSQDWGGTSLIFFSSPPPAGGNIYHAVTLVPPER